MMSGASRVIRSTSHTHPTSSLRLRASSLAPNAKLRALVVPQKPKSPAQATQPAQCEANCAHHRPVRLSWARLLKRVRSTRSGP